MCLMLFMQCQQDKALNAVIYILFASSNWILGAVVETSEVSLRQLLISTSVKLLLKWVDFFLSSVWSGEYLIQLWNFCFDVQQWSKSECMPSIPGWVGADQGWLESRSLPSFSCLFLALNAGSLTFLLKASFQSNPWLHGTAINGLTHVHWMLIAVTFPSFPLYLTALFFLAKRMMIEVMWVCAGISLSEHPALCSSVHVYGMHTVHVLQFKYICSSVQQILFIS